MEIYLFAERGYNGTKISTLKAFSDFTSVGKAVIEVWSKEKSQNYTLEKYVALYCPAVFRVEPDSDKSVSRLGKSTVWKKMRADSNLKVNITKALLKAGA